MVQLQLTIAGREDEQNGKLLTIIYMKLLVTISKRNQEIAFGGQSVMFNK